jgi:hypothetical protein
MLKETIVRFVLTIIVSIKTAGIIHKILINQMKVPLII